jgi:hypothetical protein
MKINIQKILLLAFFIMDLGAGLVFADVPKCNSIPMSGDETALRIKVSVSFTIARRRDCEGFGICDISVSVTRTAPNSATAAIYTDDYNRNILVLEIDKAKGMSLETYKKYFSSGTFVMEDDSPVPAEILNQLGITGSRTMIAGKHRVTEQNGILYVSIPVK